ncbi:MAG TPA: hypothetical protein VGR05_01065 [Sphingomicrobium sp.]|nr:hypothetical protein [Sphingomicrobium sp.]
MRIALLLAVMGGAACISFAPVRSAASPDPLLRSTGPEVRFRCGSEVLRAKLRGGRLMVQTANGDRAVLTRVTGPSAVPQSPAYGDGRLTLYKVKGPQSWALARTGQAGPPVHCTPQKRVP